MKGSPMLVRLRDWALTVTASVSLTLALLLVAVGPFLGNLIDGTLREKGYPGRAAILGALFAIAAACGTAYAVLRPPSHGPDGA